MRRLRAATAAEAIQGLKRTKEAHVLSRQWRGFVEPVAWQQIAYLSMCQRTGSADELLVLGATAVLEPNGSVRIFAFADSTPPPEEGIAAEFRTQSEGTYACTVRVSGSAADNGPCEFSIDSTILGNLDIRGAARDYTFVVRLGAGLHVFRVKALHTSFWFHSLTIFQVPELAPA
jgi:hypothetical protein